MYVLFARVCCLIGYSGGVIAAYSFITSDFSLWMDVWRWGEYTKEEGWMDHGGFAVMDRRDNSSNRLF
jgi:hypothetical protein